MSINRLTSHLQSDHESSTANPFSAAATGQVALVMIPLAMPTAAWQQLVYRMAYEMARALVATPIHERIIEKSWN